MMKSFFASAAVALSLIAGVAQAAPVNGTGLIVTPGVIFGTGNPNGSFTGVNPPLIELGLRAKQRYDLLGNPTAFFGYDNVDTYTFNSSTGAVPLNRSFFNFEWAINTLTGALSDFTFRISVDLDPTVNVGSVVTYNPFSNGGTGWWNQSGTFLGPLTNVAQTSVNLGFAPISTAVGSGQYTITLSAFQNTGSRTPYATTSINVIVDAPVPIPLPAAGFLLIGALGGLAALRRRRRVA